MIERREFEHFVMGAIVVNAFILMLHHWEEPPALTLLIEIASTICTLFFAFELSLKVVAYGAMPFLRRSYWNVYDALVVGLALTALIVNQATDVDFQAVASTARATRILLVFRIVRGAKSLQEVRCGNAVQATS